MSFCYGGGDDGDDQVVLGGAALVAGVEQPIVRRKGWLLIFRERGTLNELAKEMKI